MMQKVCIVIPAYNPHSSLLDMVRELQKHSFLFILVVNDGSETGCRPLFQALEENQVVVLTHRINKGKGAALKTGFEYIRKQLSHCIGVVTADADSQHSISDIIMMANQLVRDPHSLHLGVRKFKKNVPLKSYLGNLITRFIYHFIVRQDIIDTQTGLRAVPVHFLERLCEIKYNGYEFELAMLLSMKRAGIAFKQHVIQTIYKDNNAGSHFHPIFDSLKIYWVFCRFIFNSSLFFLMEVALFFTVYRITHALFFSLIIAKIFSSCCNLIFNKNSIFSGNSRTLKSLSQYGSLIFLYTIMLYILIKLYCYFAINVYFARIIADATIYIVSFIVQNFIIFKKRKNSSCT